MVYSPATSRRARARLRAECEPLNHVTRVSLRGQHSSTGIRRSRRLSRAKSLGSRPRKEPHVPRRPSTQRSSDDLRRNCPSSPESRGVAAGKRGLHRLGLGRRLVQLDAKRFLTEQSAVGAEPRWAVRVSSTSHHDRSQSTSSRRVRQFILFPPMASRTGSSSTSTPPHRLRRPAARHVQSRFGFLPRCDREIPQ